MSGTPTDVGGAIPAVRPEASVTDVNVTQPEPIKTEDEGASAAEPQETPEQADEREKKKRDGGWQRKIKRLDSAVQGLAAERESALARVRELESKLATTPASSAGGDEPKAPRVEDFRSYEEFERADRKFVADQAVRNAVSEFKKAEAERAEKETRAEEVKRIKEARARFDDAADKVAEHYEDFPDVMDDLWRGRIEVVAKNNAVAQYLIEVSDRGPELAYHLANNEADADRIGKLSPMAQVRALAHLEASLPKPNAPATKAPPPPKNVGSRGGPDAKDPEKMTIDEMRKATGTRRIVDY